MERAQGGFLRDARQSGRQGGRLAAALAAGLFACAAAAGAPARAQSLMESPGGSAPLESDKPALITADELTYNEELGTVTASGNVEIEQEGRILLADSVSYNQDTEVVVASGNVSMLNENGDVYFSEYAELTGDLQEGFIQGVRALLADGVTRVAAARGIRTEDNRTVFEDSKYTPCRLCRENPDAPPIWQLSADKVIHDQADQEVRYRDVTLDIFGVPVFYSPYFEHPDPTVRRKSGFLTPSYQSSDFLGSQVVAPYFWAIDDDVDVTVTPTFTTKQNPYLTLEYRQIFPSGSLDVVGSGTLADREDTDGTIRQDVVRGHIDASGRFRLARNWRTGFDVFRMTDDTYDQLYGIAVPDTRARLASNAFVEGFGGRNYFSANAFSYQSLRSEEDDRLQPFVVPELDFNYVSHPLFADSYITSDTNLLYLTREEGRQVARASMVNGWTLPYTSDWGDVWTLRTRLQTDAYWTVGNDPSDPNNFDTGNDGETDFAGRVFPQAALEWRYPWVAQADGWEHIFQPMAQFVAGPNGEWFNRGAIPNEDSLDFEFDDTTLFQPDRFNGVDRVDPGVRFDYGFQYGVFTGDEFYSEFFLGQSWRLSDNDVFTENSGLSEAGASDIVGRVYFQPIREFSGSYRFRIDEETLEPQVHEVTAVAGIPKLQVQAQYSLVNSQFDASGTEIFPKRESLTLGLSSRVLSSVTATATVTRDLALGLNQKSTFALTYLDDCFFLSVSAERRNFEDRDLEPDDRIFVTVGLAQLGQFGTTFEGGGLGGSEEE
jgi:LPS-assembly protein